MSARRWRVDLGSLAYACRRSSPALLNAGGAPSATRLARLAGVDRSTLASVLKGTTAAPSSSFMCCLADALGVDVLDLMVEEER